MRKNLQPLETLLKDTLCEYKNSERILKKKDLIDMLEDSLWLAPEYGVFRVCRLDARYNGSGYTGFAVCYKNSGRKMRGGCYVGIEYIQTGIVIREIVFNNEVL